MNVCMSRARSQRSGCVRDTAQLIGVALVDRTNVGATARKKIRSSVHTIALRRAAHKSDDLHTCTTRHMPREKEGFQNPQAASRVNTMHGLGRGHTDRPSHLPTGHMCSSREPPELEAAVTSCRREDQASHCTLHRVVEPEGVPRSTRNARRAVEPEGVPGTHTKSGRAGGSARSTPG